MEVAIHTLLLLLWLKTLMNWTVVVAWWPHTVRTLSGFLCLSLAVTDTLLDAAATQVFLAEDVSLLDMRLTRYHVCLLVQVSGFVYGVLHWPAFLLIGLDTYWTASAEPRWPRRLAYTCGTFLLWLLAALYVFRRPDSSPVTEREMCVVSGSPQSSQVASVVLLMVGGVLLHTSVAKGEHDRRDELRRSAHAFLSTWSSFLVLLVLLLGFQAEIPAYLDMNAPWLCLLHRFHEVLMLNSCSCVLCSEEKEEGAMWVKTRGSSRSRIWSGR